MRDWIPAIRTQVRNADLKARLAQVPAKSLVSMFSGIIKSVESAVKASMPLNVASKPIAALPHAPEGAIGVYSLQSTGEKVDLRHYVAKTGEIV